MGMAGAIVPAGALATGPALGRILDPAAGGQRVMRRRILGCIETEEDTDTPEHAAQKSPARAKPSR
jgi:hypothetical protein